MTELQRYLAEEVAEDHADGIITRREAMRRLGLLGLARAAAGLPSLLAPRRRRPAPRGHGAPDGRTAGAAGRTGRRSPTRGDHVRRARGRTLQGAWAPAAERRAAPCS